MKTASIFAPVMLMALASAQEEEQQTYEFGTNDNECLVMDADHVVIYDQHWRFAGGEWIDDGQILHEKWQPGMGVRAINYCVDDVNDTFRSMQLMVGNDGTEFAAWVPLRKHGADGGICRRWRLQPEDYIRVVQYTWNRHTESVVQVVFQTHLGQTRVFGRGEGIKVNFDYHAFQPFVGMVSYERDEMTLGIGAYEDDCHMSVQAERLPFGFGTSKTNLPSMSEVEGHHSVASMTWNNEEHGNSAIEVEMLDMVEEQEKQQDDAVEDGISHESHVANAKFEQQVNVENSVIINTAETKTASLKQQEGSEVVYFPPVEREIPEPSVAVEEIDNGEVKQIDSAAIEQTKELQNQIEMLRKQLEEKDKEMKVTLKKFQSQKVIERVVEDKEEADTTISDTLVLVMGFLMLMMIIVVICLCCTIRSQRKRRQEDALKLQRAAKATIDLSDDESERTPSKGKMPVAIESAVVGAPGDSQLNLQHRMQGTGSTAGLIVEKPDLLGQTTTHMLSAQTYQTYLTEKQNVIAKQSSSDALANPADIQLDFAENQPAAFNTTPAKPTQTVSTTPTPVAGGTTATGKNPFADSNSTHRSDDDGDLNLTENSVKGISPRAPQENNTKMQNPAYQF